MEEVSCGIVRSENAGGNLCDRSWPRFGTSRNEYSLSRFRLPEGSVSCIQQWRKFHVESSDLKTQVGICAIDPGHVLAPAIMNTCFPGSVYRKDLFPVSNNGGSFMRNRPI